MSVRVAVEPVGDDWSEWFLEMSIERRIPKAALHGMEVGGLDRVLIEERDSRVLASSIEAVFTVIGFSDYSGRLYAVESENAEVSVSLPPLAAPPSTSTMMIEGADGERGHEGGVNELDYAESTGTSARETGDSGDSGSSINPLLAAAALAATVIAAVIAVAAARLRS